MGSAKSRLLKPAVSVIPAGMHLARVIKVYDGDTITVAMIHQKVVFEYVLRLNGIDTPELKYKGLNKKTENDNSEKIKQLKELRRKGFEARARLIQLLDECPKILGQSMIYVDCQGKEKFGRLLAVIYPPAYDGCMCGKMIPAAKSFNQVLLDEGHAKPYDGGPREIDDSEAIE